MTSCEANVRRKSRQKAGRGAEALNGRRFVSVVFFAKTETPGLEGRSLAGDVAFNRDVRKNICQTVGNVSCDPDSKAVRRSVFYSSVNGYRNDQRLFMQTGIVCCTINGNEK